MAFVPDSAINDWHNKKKTNRLKVIKKKLTEVGMTPFEYWVYQHLCQNFCWREMRVKREIADYKAVAKALKLAEKFAWDCLKALREFGWLLEFQGDFLLLKGFTGFAKVKWKREYGKQKPMLFESSEKS